jgi:hypothetical protein
MHSKEGDEICQLSSGAWRGNILFDRPPAGRAQLVAPSTSKRFEYAIINNKHS